jgi:hypothetical protein
MQSQLRAIARIGFLINLLVDTYCSYINICIVDRKALIWRCSHMHVVSLFFITKIWCISIAAACNANGPFMTVDLTNATKRI